jgi:lysophospholipase L1-like esterase
VKRSTAVVAVLLASLAGCMFTPAVSPAPSAPSASPTSAAPGIPRAARNISLGEVKVLEVIGDSVSLGVNACAQPGPCPDSAWAGGSDPAVDSIASRLANVSGAAPEVLLGAKDGGDVAEAVRRIGLPTAKDPDLVTILVGANDVCAPSTTEMTSVADFRRDFAAMLAALHTNAPGALALVLSVPDLNQIWELGKDNPRAISQWSRFPGCRNLLREPTWATPPNVEASRAAAAERVVEFNQVVAEVCAAAENCISDGGALYKHPLSAAEISPIDFFHPSVHGQRAIAELAWQVLTEQVKL